MGRKAKPTPLKFCMSCGNKLERLREKDGDLQSLLHFSRRKFCSRECMADGFRAKQNESRHRDRRERIATAALQGLLAHYGENSRYDNTESREVVAVAYADALIRELDKKEDKT